MKVLYPLSLALFVVAVPCCAQTGTVTFYTLANSVKQTAKEALIPVGTAPFTGWLFDGDQKMAHSQIGRFMNFHVVAGEHRFTVPYNRGPEKPVDD